MISNLNVSPKRESVPSPEPEPVHFRPIDIDWIDLIMKVVIGGVILYGIAVFLPAGAAGGAAASAVFLLSQIE